MRVACDGALRLGKRRVGLGRVRDALGVPPKRERSICIGTSLEATREWWNETMKRPRFEASPPETDGNESGRAA
jgi:hypothetical protein